MEIIFVSFVPTVVLSQYLDSITLQGTLSYTNSLESKAWLKVKGKNIKETNWVIRLQTDGAKWVKSALNLPWIGHIWLSY